MKHSPLACITVFYIATKKTRLVDNMQSKQYFCLNKSGMTSYWSQSEQNINITFQRRRNTSDIVLDFWRLFREEIYHLKLWCEETVLTCRTMSSWSDVTASVLQPSRLRGIIRALDVGKWLSGEITEHLKVPDVENHWKQWTNVTL